MKYTLDQILENQENFEQCLLHSLILFPVDSEHYKYSGPCTAALLNGYCSEEAILAIQSRFDGWNTFKFSTKEELRTFLSCKPEICPKDATGDEDCYILE